MASGSDPMSPSSPVCAAGAGDDVYMHRAATDEVLELLNELLAAERAGTRVARESRRDCATAEERDLLSGIFADEANWCRVLTTAIAALGGTPTGETGDFHRRAMAIADLGERLRFLNRGQGWVAKRLGTMIPRLAEGELRSQLIAMRENHDANISRVNDFLSDSA